MQKLFESGRNRPVPHPKDPIWEAVCALTDPIIVCPGGGWENDIPQGMKDRLPMDRLAHQMLCLRGKANWDEATDLEAMLYLFPASLVAPMPHHWTNIYLYLGGVCLRELKEEQDRRLDETEMGMLRDLKRWIRQKQLEARARKERGEPVKMPAKQPDRKGAVVPLANPQMKLF